MDIEEKIKELKKLLEPVSRNPEFEETKALIDVLEQNVGMILRIEALHELMEQPPDKETVQSRKNVEDQLLDVEIDLRGELGEYYSENN